MIRNAFHSGIDILCLNQWATAPNPFFFYEALARTKSSQAYEVEDCRGYMVVWQAERRLLLIKGLEIAVLTDECSLGEVILLGVDSDFPVEVGELPGLTASPRQKSRLWQQVCAYMDAGHYWLAIVPHPCFEGGFGSEVTKELVGSGRLDTFEQYNSMLALFDPPSNRMALDLEKRLSADGYTHFSGITGNDGIDPKAPTLSLTQLALDSEPAGIEGLLSALAVKIRRGQVITHCRQAQISHAAWKFLHSERKWSYVRHRLLTTGGPTRR
jgi:hypothetical protein